MKTVRAYIYGELTEHLNQSIKSVAHVSKLRDLPLKEITVIGGIGNALFNPRVLELVEQYGLEVSFKEALPPKYELAYSPALVVETEHGEIVLEALEKYSDYFDAEGNFMPPVDVENLFD